MKIRKGFVSNSSSSSFVSYEDSSFDIAIQMIPLREWNEEDVKLIKKTFSFKSVMPKDSALRFQTCNYDTYIFKQKDCFKVLTCHNHDFFDVECLSSSGNKYDEYLSDFDLKNVEFFDLENEVFFYYDPEAPFCSTHAIEKCKLSRGDQKGKVVCPVCFFEDKQKKNAKSNIKKITSISDSEDLVLAKIAMNDKLNQAVDLAREGKHEEVKKIMDEFQKSLLGK